MKFEHNLKPRTMIIVILEVWGEDNDNFMV